ncbi:tyrosine-type recombinase/integrase [Acetobacter thailandicus]|uniref:tyrosine-type recombinase/integrase n=1 Tax=Acetobacter thailandicus TaxID=1502842 RepID=UPI001BA91CF6|nr:site-specific integrase [Acetobacter thailandicus]MBS0980753.1 tyrosine-type recombinase/integrase [Acetobacter thailandicus]
MGRLSATSVRAAKEPGRYGDGDGLYLVVTPSGSKSWVCRVQKNGKRRDIGLGSVKKVPLALARERAVKTRMQVEVGIDPVSERRKEAGVPTFREAVSLVFAENKASWKNQKHRAQWLSTLERYAFPVIGDLSISELDGHHERDVVAPIWLEKPETARRVRQRIGVVVDWAIGKGYRTLPLPLAAMDKSLPRIKSRPVHHAALPYAEVPQFLSYLLGGDSIGRLALSVLILTATRSGEIRGATWDEIDFENALWTIPAERMKAGREHVIPLSPPALALLRKAATYREARSPLVFPGQRGAKPLSDMTLTKICRDAKIEAVPHGFRSSFRDWVAEETTFDGDIAEMALAHAIGNKVEAAYRRGNLLEKRRVMMDAWGQYCV